MKHILIAIAVLFAACALKAADDRVVAVVGDKVFTRYDVLQSMQVQLRQLAATCDGVEFELQKQRLYDMSLDALVNRELIYLDFKSLKNAKIPDSFTQDRIDRVIAERAGGDEVAFEEQLYNDGMTMREFREKVFKEVAVDVLLKNRVNNGISISDEAIEAQFNARKAEYVKPARYHLCVLLLKGDGRYGAFMPETVAEIKKAIAAKTPFAELARKYSEGPNAENGGDLGWMDAPNEQLLAVLKALANGQTAADPVVMGSNRYFIHLLEKQGGGTAVLDPELKAKIKDELERQEKGRRYAEYIKQLKMKYPVRILDEK